MEAIDIHTILDKPYSHLTSKEKETYADLFTNEDEFLLLQQTMKQINELANQTLVEPSPKVKTNLDQLFHQTYRSKGLMWYNHVGLFMIHPDKRWHQQNITRMAAVLLLCISLFPFLTRTPISAEKKQLAKVEQLSTEKPSKAASETPEIDKANEVKLAKAESTSTLEREVLYPKVEEMNANDVDKMIVPADEISVKEDIPTAPAMMSDHPDGVFKDVILLQDASFVLSRHLDVLDILTVTY
jgi:hypothetical protein